MKTAKTRNKIPTPPAKPKSKNQYRLLDAIRKEKNYKNNINRRDKNSRLFLEENYKNDNQSALMPGQLVLFNYFYPKTEEKLQYYDAMPCTIFFGIIKTNDGPRVIGFNIHYYPPKIRFLLMDRIFEIFKSIYYKNWSKPITSEIDAFNYKMLIQQLQKAKLDFGVREYIPNLMHEIRPIPSSGWSQAVFTEGRFKKETREQIMHYWKNKVLDIDKPKKTK